MASVKAAKAKKKAAHKGKAHEANIRRSANGGYVVSHQPAQDNKKSRGMEYHPPVENTFTDHPSMMSHVGAIMAPDDEG